MGTDTCAPEDIGDWSEENPARGQCATTAVVVHDYFGGDLVRGEVHVRGERVDFHWRNRLPDGSEIDLTREQFSVQESVIGGVYVPRPTGWTRLDYEYSLLSGRVAEHLKRSPTTFLASQVEPHCTRSSARCPCGSAMAVRLVMPLRAHSSPKTPINRPPCHINALTTHFQPHLVCTVDRIILGMHTADLGLKFFVAHSPLAPRLQERHPKIVEPAYRHLRIAQNGSRRTRG